MDSLIEFLGKLNDNILIIVGLITSLIFLATQIRNLKTSLISFTKKIFEDEFDAVHSDIKALSEKIDSVEQNATRNFLVRCITDFDNGTRVSEAVKIRFWDEYDRYTDPKGMNQNSYIKTNVNRLEKEGKISR